MGCLDGAFLVNRGDGLGQRVRDDDGRQRLAIVDEVAARYPIGRERFYLHGFSGGGQFTHRFLYLHPERLAAVVGAEDTDTFEINNPGESNWMDGCEKTGRTRIERLETLRRGYEAHGIDVTFDLVEGAGHSGMAVLPAVERFFGLSIKP